MHVSKPKCAFVPQGRFGNRLFQYLACKLVCLIHDYEYIDSPAKLTRPLMTLYESEADMKWKTVEPDVWCVEADPVSAVAATGAQRHHLDVLLHGFYQNFEWVNRYNDRIQSFLNAENSDVFYDTIRIQDLFGALNTQPSIVLHVRLDDFFHPGGKGTNVVSLAYYKRCAAYLWESHPETRVLPVWVVAEPCRTPQERAYLKTLVSDWSAMGFKNIQLHQQTLLDDWRKCRDALYLIASNSTFAWSALVASRPRPLVAILPDTHYYPHQVLVPLASVPTCLVWETDVVN